MASSLGQVILNGYGINGLGYGSLGYGLGYGGVGYLTVPRSSRIYATGHRTLGYGLAPAWNGLGWNGLGWHGLGYARTVPGLGAIGYGLTYLKK